MHRGIDVAVAGAPRTADGCWAVDWADASGDRGGSYAGGSLRYGALDLDTVPLSCGDHALTYVTQALPVFFAAGRCRSPSLSCGRPAGIAFRYMPCFAADGVDDLLSGCRSVVERSY